jgi:hypothetical protein
MGKNKEGKMKKLIAILSLGLGLGACSQNTPAPPNPYHLGHYAAGQVCSDSTATCFTLSSCTAASGEPATGPTSPISCDGYNCHTGCGASPDGFACAGFHYDLVSASGPIVCGSSLVMYGMDGVYRSTDF